MKAFNQLIRLGRYRLLGQQKSLAELEAHAAELRQRADELEAEVREEEERAGTTEFGASGFGAYFERVGQTRREIADAQAKLSRDLNEARAKLRTAFKELKRIEILRDRKAAEAAEAARKEETAALDDVALTQHRRGED
jgi:flagellar FliJ protein